MPEFEPHWRSRNFWLWIGASACWLLFTAVLAYRDVLAPHLKEIADFNTCVADHGRYACSGAIRMAEGGPVLPNPYVPYVILAISGPLAMLFAWLGLAWIREGMQAGADDPET